MNDKVNDANTTLPILEPSQHDLESIIISRQDVLDVLQQLNVNKASGPVSISPRLLREGAIILAHPLSIFFSRFLTQGHFPSSWIDANLTTINKKDKKSQPSDCRPRPRFCTYLEFFQNRFESQCSDEGKWLNFSK